MRDLDDSVPVSEEVLITPFTPAELEARIVRARRRLQPAPLVSATSRQKWLTPPLIAANPRHPARSTVRGTNHDRLQIAVF